MNTASLELCKELYELSGWKDTAEWWLADKVAPKNQAPGPAMLSNRNMAYWTKESPAYDLGYLLRKPPSGAGVIKNSKTYTARRPNMYGAPENKDPFNGRTGWEADTPENALAVLAIELFKAGVLGSDMAASKPLDKNNTANPSSEELEKQREVTG